MSYTERYIFQSSLLIMTPHSFRLNAEGTGGIPVTFPSLSPHSSNRAKKRSIGGRLSWQTIDVGWAKSEPTRPPVLKPGDLIHSVVFGGPPGAPASGRASSFFFSTRSSARLEQWRSKPAPLKYVTLDHQLVGTPLFKGGVKNETTCCRHHAIKKKWLLERAISFYNCQPAKGLFEGALNCVRPATYPDGQIIK